VPHMVGVPAAIRKGSLMASFLSFLLDTEKALEDKIRTLLDKLPTSEDPDTLKSEVKKLEAQLTELKKRRTL